MRWVAGLVVLAAVTGCGSSAKPQPPVATARPQAQAQAKPQSAAELRAHLLPAVMPDGWHSVADPQGHDAKGASGASATPAACTELLDGQTVVDAATKGSSALATAMFSGGHTAGGGVNGGLETLYSFAGDGAHRAMQDMRTLVARCRKVELPHASWEPADTAGFVVAEGPRLGDESLVVQGTVTEAATGYVERADATVVRVGSSLVVISTVFSLTQQEVDAVMAFTPAAVAQVESNHPEPVDAAS